MMRVASKENKNVRFVHLALEYASKQFFFVRIRTPTTRARTSQAVMVR
jgi:hypothetical protein